VKWDLSFSCSGVKYRIFSSEKEGKKKNEVGQDYQMQVKDSKRLATASNYNTEVLVVDTASLSRQSSMGNRAHQQRITVVP